MNQVKDLQVFMQNNFFTLFWVFLCVNKMSSIISLKNVTKHYPMGEVTVKALAGISLDIEEGDFVAIIGSSGSGKSTLMNMVGCLDLPTTGTILLKDKDITSLSESRLASFRGKTIGFIFQQYNLLPTLSALENVLLPLELQEVPDAIASSQAISVLDQVGLGDKLTHLPSQLSGGQQQRVSVARCLAANPEIILADEPTGALDSKTGKDLLGMLHNLWVDGKTIIMVTHDLQLASYAHTIIELKDGLVVDVRENLNVLKKKI